MNKKILCIALAGMLAASMCAPVSAAWDDPEYYYDYYVQAEEFPYFYPESTAIIYHDGHGNFTTSGGGVISSEDGVITVIPPSTGNTNGTVTDNNGYPVAPPGWQGSGTSGGGSYTDSSILQYPIVTRALYNCNRLISSQYEGCYEKIKKVYSIWICTNPPENRKNCIYRYRIAENLFAGRTNVMEERHHYDMLTALIFCLGQPEDRKVNNALDLLNSLFSERLTAKQKIKKLKEYDIPITQQLTEKVSLICSLSQENEERGIQKGIEKGICGAIDICRKLNLPEEEILQQIMQQYELSEDIAREYLQKEE